MASKFANGDDFISCFESSVHTTHVKAASSPPGSCLKEPCILGVDEAGRGPVLGPMVYGITYCPLSKKKEFETLGCADSKALTEKRREELFAILCACEEYVGWSVDIISPNFISNNMLRRAKHSLNEVAQDSTVRLIQNAMAAGVRVAEIYVDTVGPPEKYQDKLSKVFPQCNVTVAKKADSLYPIVSAASICAKVCRDKIISHWKFTEDINYESNNYGSGYPNDPDTKRFLTSAVDNIFGFPNLVRFSWSTASKALETTAAAVEWDEMEDEEKPSIKNFFTATTSLGGHAMKHEYFKTNMLSNVNSLF